MNQFLKTTAAVMLAAMMTVTAHAQVSVPDWENPAVLGINKLPYHATLQLPSKEKACKEIISLDGDVAGVRRTQPPRRSRAERAGCPGRNL